MLFCLLREELQIISKTFPWRWWWCAQDSEQTNRSGGGPSRPSVTWLKASKRGFAPFKPVPSAMKLKLKTAFWVCAHGLWITQKSGFCQLTNEINCLISGCTNSHNEGLQNYCHTWGMFTKIWGFCLSRCDLITIHPLQPSTWTLKFSVFVRNSFVTINFAWPRRRGYHRN